MRNFTNQWLKQNGDPARNLVTRCALPIAIPMALAALAFAGAVGSGCATGASNSDAFSEAQEAGNPGKLGLTENSNGLSDPADAAVISPVAGSLTEQRAQDRVALERRDFTNSMPAPSEDLSKPSPAFNETGPQGVCRSIVAAARRDDFKGVQKYTFWSPARVQGVHGPRGQSAGIAANSGFHKMRAEYLAMMRDVSCGAEHVAGDHAFVESGSDDQPRLIPFVRRNGEWRVDMRTYLSFYREAHKVMVKPAPRLPLPSENS